MDEDAETGARRELKEETGLETPYVEQFGCFSEVNRDPRERVITIAFYALVRKSEVKGGDDASDAHWFPIDNVPALAFDHDRILRVALKTLKEKIHFMPVGFELLPQVFTMPQLQELSTEGAAFLNDFARDMEAAAGDAKAQGKILSDYIVRGAKLIKEKLPEYVKLGKELFSGLGDGLSEAGPALLDMGLDIPDITRVFLRLQQMGLPLEPVYTIDQAIAAVKNLKEGK